MSTAQPYIATVELDDPFPAREVDSDDLVAALTRDLDVHGGIVARSLAGRVQVVMTVHAEDLRAATQTALAIVIAAVRRPVGIEVVPEEDYDRRADAVTIPALVSVPEAAAMLGRSRQHALELAKSGKLDAVKVGDSWVISRRSVVDRASSDGTFWSGMLIPVGVLSDTGQLVEPDALSVEDLPLELLDEQGNTIGLVRGVQETDEGWRAQGRVRGLELGEYAVAPTVEKLVRDERGEVTHILSGVITGVTVLTSPGREPSFPGSRIRVGDHPATPAVEVHSYS